MTALKESDKTAAAKKTLSRLAALAIAVSITVGIFAFRDQVKDLAGYGYLGIFLISVLGNATIVLPVPTILVALIGGGLFNPVIVALIAATGATIGELTGYLAGYGGQAVIENRAMYDRMEGWMRRYGALTIFVLATIPNPFFDLAGITAGILRFPVAWFLLCCWAGKTVKFLLIAFLGAQSFGVLEQFLH